MTRHARYTELLARRPELGPLEEAQLRDHLETCSDCRETAAAYERQSRMLRSMAAVDPPAALRTGVLAGIRRVTVSSSPWYRHPAALAAPLMAAVLVIALFARAQYSGKTGHSALSQASMHSAVHPASATPVSRFGSLSPPRPVSPGTNHRGTANRLPAVKKGAQTPSHRASQTRSAGSQAAPVLGQRLPTAGPQSAGLEKATNASRPPAVTRIRQGTADHVRRSRGVRPRPVATPPGAVHIAAGPPSAPPEGDSSRTRVPAPPPTAASLTAPATPSKTPVPAPQQPPIHTAPIMSTPTPTATPRTVPPIGTPATTFFSPVTPSPSPTPKP